MDLEPMIEVLKTYAGEINIQLLSCFPAGSDHIPMHTLLPEV